MKPNFLVIGAPKCATTSLCHNLSQHPEVFMSSPKELFFFSYDNVFAKGWGWYSEHFHNAESFKAIGEGTTVYSQTGTFPKALDRIVEYLPESKIIYITRHPLERIQSHWIEMHSQGLTMQPFNQAVIEDPQYIDASSYFKQLSEYRKYFPDDRILTLFYEDYRNDPNQVLKECFNFLEVDETFIVGGADKPIYASIGKRSDRKITNILRRNIPGFLRIRDSMPNSVRQIVKKILKKEISGKPQWDAEVKEYVIRELKNDTKNFLRLMDKPSDYWIL